MKTPDIKQIISTVQDLAKKRAHLLQTKPEIHGINPRGVIEETGEIVELPRFSSIEMQTAQKMNKIALRQAKTGIQRTFTNATPEDYQRLTSTRIQDSYARAEWTNPKDGKLYHLLKQGETEDGKVIVRILDTEGAFIKEAELTPKIIAIPDVYNVESRYFGMSHGDIVTTFARRHNPFARYVPCNVSLMTLHNQTELREIVEYVNKGNRIDYISGSIGRFISGQEHKIKEFTLKEQVRKFNPELFDYEDLSSKGIRILIGSGNAKTEEELTEGINNLILSYQPKAEGVGSISPKTGKISEFSGSRNSELTQHYEVGEATPKLTRHGINITGLPGTDIKFSNQKLEELSKNPLVGKPVDKVKALQTKIEARIKELENAKMNLFTQKLPLPELMEKSRKLDEAIQINRQRKKKLLDFAFQLIQRKGMYEVALPEINGTSLSTPIRVAKLALNDMMEGII